MRTRTWGAVHRATGVAYHQFDHWCRSGLFGPRMTGGGSGRPRLFTDAHVALLRLLGALSPTLLAEGGQGVGIALFRFVAQEAAEMDLSHGWLVVAPGRVMWVGEARRLPAAWAGLDAFMVVCLSDDTAGACDAEALTA